MQTCELCGERVETLHHLEELEEFSDGYGCAVCVGMTEHETYLQGEREIDRRDAHETD